MPKALVVFARDPQVWWQHLLRRYRHCFAVVEADGFWVGVDVVAGGVVARVVCDSGFDAETYYRSRGFQVVRIDIDQSPFRTVPALATCVTLTKRAIGCRSWALTPYGLYRYLVSHRTC